MSFARKAPLHDAQRAVLKETRRKMAVNKAKSVKIANGVKSAFIHN